MIENIDHYHALGLVSNAEPIVIKAAYKSLVSIYHPDKNSAPDAQEKIRKINAAYETLSDPIKRKAYDEKIKPHEHSASSSEFDREQYFSSALVEHHWAIAAGFYPNIKYLYEDLERISCRLAFGFKLQLLEEKNYLEAAHIARRLKALYLSRYFGKNKDICSYAEDIIKSKNILAALRLNEIINVMGLSVSAPEVSKKINKEFPNLFLALKNRRLYSRIKNSSGFYDPHSANALLKAHGGEVKRRFFTQEITLNIDGEIFHLKNESEFCEVVLKHYAAQYV